MSGDCNESVPAFRSNPLAGSLGGLPDIRVWIVGADYVEESFTLAGLPGFLPSDDRSKPWIVIS